MATEEPGRAPATLTALPRVEDLPLAGEGYDPVKVREAFDSYRRHALQLQAQLRVLQAAGGSARVEPTAHAVRMDALHLIRSAAEFADQLERDAQRAAAAQLGHAEEEIRKGQHELQARAAELERYRQESERQRADLLNAARNEARDLLAAANRDAAQELREAEARGARLLEQSRHQATELTNAARAEVEQTLEWARSQASTVINRAQQGAEQLLSAAGLAPEQMTRVIDTILRSAEATLEASRTPAAPRRPVEALAGGIPLRPAAPEIAPAPPPEPPAPGPLAAPPAATDGPPHPPSPPSSPAADPGEGERPDREDPRDS